MDTWVHDLSCVGLFVGQLVVGAIFEEPLIIYSSLGALSGLLLTPDLDWDGGLVWNHNYESRYVVTRRLAFQEKLIRKIYSRASRRWPAPFRQWWEMYARLFDHRKISHTPIIGTFTRLLWIFPILFLFVVVPVQFGLFVIGLIIADIGHWLLDGRP